MQRLGHCWQWAYGAYRRRRDRMHEDLLVSDWAEANF